MNIEIKKEADKTVIMLNGRLDTSTAPVLEKAVNDESENTDTLILDLKELVYISSAGLRVLLSAHKKMLSKGTLKITHVAETVMDVLEMTGFSDILEIE